MQRPSALSLILCHRVIVDRDTGERTYVAAFDDLTCDETPFVAPPFTVSLVLTDGQGRINLLLSVSDIDEEVGLANETLTIELSQPARHRPRPLPVSQAGVP